MKDVLYGILGSIEGNKTENLIDPVDKVDQIIHDAIEAHSEDIAGGERVANFIEVYIPYFAKRNDLASLERIRKSIEKLRKIVQMFS